MKLKLLFALVVTNLAALCFITARADQIVLESEFDQIVPEDQASRGLNTLMSQVAQPENEASQTRNNNENQFLADGTDDGSDNPLVALLKEQFCSNNASAVPNMVATRAKPKNAWMNYVCDAIDTPMITNLINENLPKTIDGVTLKMAEYSSHPGETAAQKDQAEAADNTAYDATSTTASIGFVIKEFPLGDSKTELSGSVAWNGTGSILSVSAWKSGNATAKLNDFVALDKFSLAVSIATLEKGAKMLQSAKALASVDVELGYGDTIQGALEVSYNNGNPILNGSLKMKNFTFAPGLTLKEGSLNMNYNGATKDTSISFDANLDFDTDPHKNKDKNDTISIQISGSKSSDGTIIFDGEVSSTSFIPTDFGLDFIHLGDWKIHANLTKDDVHFTINSKMCIGEYQHCISNITANLEKVVITDAVFKYQCTVEADGQDSMLQEYLQHGPKHAALISQLAEPNAVHADELIQCEGKYAIYAKVSPISISLIVSAVGGNNAGKQIPAVLDAKLVPIQPDCEGSTNVSECYWVVGMASEATKVDDQVTLKPGFSLFANLDLPVLNNTLLVNMVVMQTGTGADESLLETTPSTSTSTTALECTVALANTNGSVTPDPSNLVFSFTKDLHSGKDKEKLKWDMSIGNALLIVKGAIQKQFPDESDDIESAYKFVEDPIAFVESLAAKEGFNLKIDEDFTSEDRKYLAVAGSEKSGGFGLTMMGEKCEKAFNGSNPGTGMLFSLSMTSDGLSELFKKIFDSDTDPLASVPIFSNANVAAMVATKDMTLPNAISLPPPYSSITNVKKGLWLEGQLRKPTECKDSPVCAILDKALVGNKSYLSLKAGISTSDISLSIGLQDVQLSEKVSLSCELGFDAKLEKVPEVTISAQASLAVDLHQSLLTFTGELNGKLSAEGPAIGLGFAMSGMYTNAFGLQNFNLYDLVLEGSISAAGLQSFLFGGGLCFGKANACAKLTDNLASELLYQRMLPSDRLDLFQDDSISVVPHPKMAHEIFGSDQRAWPAYMREELDMDTLEVHASGAGALNITAKTPAGVQSGGAIAAKAYIGMDLPDQVFLYAAISEVSLMDLTKAFTGNEGLPSWLGKIAIKPYDMDACAKDKGGAACFAYVSFATVEKKISILNPPLTIPQGFAAQGTLDFLGAEMSFNIQILTNPKKFMIDLEGPPLKMWNDNIQILESEGSESGPALNATADLSTGDFSLSFKAYAKVGDLGSGSIDVDITNQQAEIDITIEDSPGIFGSGLGAQTKLILNLDDPGASSITADITLSSSLSQPLKAAGELLQEGIHKVVQLITAALKTLTDASQDVINKFNQADQALNQAQNSINQKQYNVDVKEGQSWHWGYWAELAGMKALVWAEQTLVNIAYDLVNDLRYGFEQVKNTLQEAQTKVQEGGKSAENAVAKITSFTLKEVGFSASGVSKSVELFAVVGFEGGDTTRHSFGFDFADGITGIAKQLEEEFLKGIETAASDMLTQIKDSVSGMSLEMELMEVLQDHHRADLVQLGFLKKQITADGEVEYVHPNPEWTDARHEAVVKEILKRKQARAAAKAEL